MASVNPDSHVHTEPPVTDAPHAGTAAHEHDHKLFGKDDSAWAAKPSGTYTGLPGANDRPSMYDPNYEIGRVHPGHEVGDIHHAHTNPPFPNEPWRDETNHRPAVTATEPTHAGAVAADTHGNHTKPSIVDRAAGTAEVLLGKVTGNAHHVEHGDMRKHGLTHDVQHPTAGESVTHK